MKDILCYEEFIGSVHFSTEDEVFFGKIEGIEDLVTFEGKSVEALKESFQNAVRDYLKLCRETGRKPLKSYKGSFNVRLPRELHRQAVLKAARLGLSLNQFVQKSIESQIQ